MNTVFINIIDYPTEESAWDAYPGAAHIEAVDGGWLIFDFLDDYHTWLGQV